MRIEGWETRMMAYLESAAIKDFDYGSSKDAANCVLLAADHIENTTGIDVLDGGRGQWHDLKSGSKIIKEKRGTIAGIIDFYFPRHDKVAMARRGDVVMLKVDGLTALGVVATGGKAYFKAHGKGLVNRLVKDCTVAWRID